MFFFGNGIDKRTLYIILGVLVLVFLLDSGTEFWISTFLTLPAVIIAICFHEYAHAWTADHFGDTTPRAEGRLTLNPVAHLDPFGFILLLFAGVGWGKPVMINPNNFTSNKTRETCEALVSLAGPLMNFLLAVVFTFIYYAMALYAPNTKIISILITLIQYIIAINIGLGVFNLIPLPPLDGEKIFRRILPYSAIEWLDRNANTLQLIFMLLWIFRVLRLYCFTNCKYYLGITVEGRRVNISIILNFEAKKMKKDIIVLGIESSCDETSVAVVKNGREILSNEINSQIDIHTEYGGVVPEIASRCHIEVINQITKFALKRANLKLEDIDVISVTQGPGLVGALLVGVSYAKGLSFASNKPLVAVNHIAGHIAANFITHKDLEPPFLCLIISRWSYIFSKCKKIY